MKGNPGEMAMAKKAVRWSDDLVQLEQIPNIGPSIAAGLRRIGIHEPADLHGQQALALYERICQVDAAQHDPCLLDVFMAAVDFVGGTPARPWWKYTAKRKRELAKARQSRSTQIPKRQAVRGGARAG
jgi:hypothetical protein